LQKGGEVLNIIKLEVTTSTSTYARENADTLRLPSLIIADKQTAGRGRSGNSFYSPDKTGLYFTLLFETESAIPLITPAAAVAVCNTIEKNFGIYPKIKWVNDIFLNNKKICGILSECFISNNKTLIAVGIGINLTTNEFPDNLPNAGSLGITCDKEKLATDIAEYILGYIRNPNENEILNQYKNRLFVLNKRIEFFENNIRYSATVRDINAQCNLIVELPDKNEKILSSGEISILI
jgi:BirA family biotin operon repressor/biotin-[acetyl-CoA-carboxylase] ligase